jgi:hypothetical protein
MFVIEVQDQIHWFVLIFNIFVFLISITCWRELIFDRNLFVARTHNYSLILQDNHLHWLLLKKEEVI